MHSAWEQIDDLIAANQLLKRAQLARSIVRSMVNRKLRLLSVDALLQLTTPLHTRLLAGSVSVGKVVRDSRLPTAAASAVFRRTVRPRGAFARRAGSRQVGDLDAMLSRLNAKKIAAAGPRLMPKGAVTPSAASDADISKLVRNDDIFLEAVEQQPGRPGFTIVTDQKPPNEHSQTIGQDSDQAKQFRVAATQFQSAIKKAHALSTPQALPALPMNSVKNHLLKQLNAARSIETMIEHRLVVSGSIADTVKQADDTLEPIMAYPTFDYPMYEALRDLSQDLLVPGLEAIEPNTVTLLETNPRFVEAYMAGLNHEMSRELLWRAFPADQLGSYFRQFWDIRGRVPAPNTLDQQEQAKDIPELHRWNPHLRLGENLTGASADSQLVLLVRGELLRRFPNAMVYAAKARFKLDSNNEPSRDREPTEEEKYPLFRGNLEPDITFLGFDLRDSEARGDPNPDNANPGWFMIFQQQPTEPRFGLDVAMEFTDSLPPLTTWSELSWGHFAEDQAALDELSHIHLDNAPVLSSGIAPSNVSWARNAAHMAFITLQRPVRIAIHADDMLPSVSGR